MVNNHRPVNLDLTTLKFPPMAIASILHRVSGLLIFILLPFMIYLLGQSLASPEAFAQLILLLGHPFYKLVVWAFSAAMVYHILAGLRHVIMDLGFGEDLQGSRLSALFVIGLAVLLTLFLGMWIW